MLGGVGPQARLESVHLVAGFAGFVKKKNGGADLRLLASKFNEFDALGLDVRPRIARRKTRMPQRLRVFGQLLALNEAHLPLGRLAGALAGPVKFPGISLDSLACHHLDGING